MYLLYIQYIFLKFILNFFTSFDICLCLYNSLNVTSATKRQRVVRGTG